MSEHNEIIKNLVAKLYSEDLKRSILKDEREKSFKFEEKEEKIIASRIIENNEEKYTLNKHNLKLDGEIKVILNDGLVFSTEYESNKILKEKEILKDNKINFEADKKISKTLKLSKGIKNNER